jgi:hypothetical protein
MALPQSRETPRGRHLQDTEDAFVLITKDEKDFERILGHKPDSGVVMTSLVDADQLQQMIGVIDNLVAWVAKMTQEIEDQFFKSRSSRGP